MPKRKKPRKPMKSASFTPTNRQKHDIPAAWKKPLCLQSQLESMYRADFIKDTSGDPLLYLRGAAPRVILAERDPTELRRLLSLEEAYTATLSLDLDAEDLAKLAAARDKVANARISGWVEKRLTVEEAIFTPLGDGAKEMGDEGKHDVASLPDRHPGGSQLLRLIERQSQRKVGANRTDRWVESVSFWIPRKNREAIMGDIQEDCVELRELGKSEWRIRANVIWQLSICALRMWPAAVKAALLAWVVAKFREMI